jgi:hypothetical protein
MSRAEHRWGVPEDGVMWKISGFIKVTGIREQRKFNKSVRNFIIFVLRKISF